MQSDKPTDAMAAIFPEMHIYKGIRDKYKLDEALFSSDGRFIFSNPAAARKLVFMLNKDRDPAQKVYAGEVYATGLIHEIYHLLLAQYAEVVNKDVFEEAAGFLEEHLGNEVLNEVLSDFTRTFPPTPVYTGRISAGEYVKGSQQNRLLLHALLEEALLLSLSNENRGNKKIRILFDKNHLSLRSEFERLIKGLEDFFATQPPYGPEHSDVISLLKSPFLRFPDDLSRQLDYILQNWKDILPGEMATRILQGQDFMKEDLAPGGPGGPPPTVVPAYKAGQEGGTMHLGKSGFDASAGASDEYAETERFTEDTHWMPRVVLMAKNTYVWLDQLSKKYQRAITRLDQIPDEELDTLAHRHFNGLWLIGLWERSSASRKIKHRMGNHDAIASAYALYDYQIAADLGGEEAWRNLSERARQRGIRLASDMVPNHTGIFSKWVIEHPEYFIQSANPPFPGYRFTGENLSDHPHVEIRIEDGYYSKSDAAVVFQRIDRQHNDIRYIYHGNDGTMMPWNDTAQLDMLKAEVREAVMQKIFDVARKFSIIRFDAAMTLAKKHFARLWYPRPGTGGDIPSRAEHALSKKEFDNLFPVEFWREVVDRINRDLPETLLLAEAFWFMEGYFVRTLGMHRVYNSAFMHMLKNEENEKYRDLITNTLEFEPEILKRYVNFMSNPDEETAIQQFGTGDKYFGVCVMMNTLPGLPMFAHGQVEGFTEKYGMEYRYARYHEDPDPHLVEKHEREIFPLTGKRHLFSEVRHFQLYDYLEHGGRINENVFAYSNSHGNETALVLFNNKYEMAHGHIHTSVPRLGPGGNEKNMTRISLADALRIKDDHRIFYVAREQISGQEYLFKGSDIHREGLFWPLRGFEYRVFLSFDEMEDPDGAVEQFYRQYKGEGVADVRRMLAGQKLAPVHRAFEEIFDEHLSTNQIREKYASFARLAFKEGEQKDQSEKASDHFMALLSGIPETIRFLQTESAWIKPMLTETEFHAPEELFVPGSSNTMPEKRMLMLASLATYSLAKAAGKGEWPKRIFDTLMLDWPLHHILQRTGRSPADIDRDIQLLRILHFDGYDLFDFAQAKLTKGRPAAKPRMDAAMEEKAARINDLLTEPLVRNYLGVNEHEGTLYYSKEQFEQLIQWLFSLGCLSYFTPESGHQKRRSPRSLLRPALLLLLLLIKYSTSAGYRLHQLSDYLPGGKSS